MNMPDLPTGGPVRALIADDERLMREQLRARLAEVWPALEIVAEAKNGLEAVELTESHHPDLVFLDIRMPGMTGVEAARAIVQLPVDDDAIDGWRGCDIVFITAYDQYAIEAFEQGVVDYVLKPAEREHTREGERRGEQRDAGNGERDHHGDGHHQQDREQRHRDGRNRDRPVLCDEPREVDRLAVDAEGAVLQ